MHPFRLSVSSETMIRNNPPYHSLAVNMVVDGSIATYFYALRLHMQQEQLEGLICTSLDWKFSKKGTFHPTWDLVLSLHLRVSECFSYSSTRVLICHSQRNCEPKRIITSWSTLVLNDGMGCDE